MSCLRFSAILLAHYVLTWISLLTSIAISGDLDQIETPGAAYEVARFAHKTLSAPLMPLLFATAAAKWFPGLWGHVPMLLNSALWATAILGLRHFFGRSDGKRSGA